MARRVSRPISTFGVAVDRGPRHRNINGGSQSVASYEDLSSSSFSSASRASLDARGSPTLSYGAENMIVFPGDSSGSI